MNYTVFPKNLIDSRYDEDIIWLVVPRQDWENNIIAGASFSFFSVATAYCRENPSKYFIITCLN